MHEHDPLLCGSLSPRLQQRCILVSYDTRVHTPRNSTSSMVLQLPQSLLYSSFCLCLVGALKIDHTIQQLKTAMMIVFNPNPRIVYWERAQSIYFPLIISANSARCILPFSSAASINIARSGARKAKTSWESYLLYL